MKKVKFQRTDHYSLEQFAELKELLKNVHNNQKRPTNYDSYWRTGQRINIDGSGDDSIYSPLFDRRREII